MTKSGRFGIVLALIFSMGFSGCAVLVIGTAGIAGGYAVSNDGIEGIKDLEFKKVWEAGLEVLGRQGTVETKDEKNGTVIAKIGGSTVRFEVRQATPKSIIVQVRARRMWRMFPDMKLARRIYSIILNEVEKGGESL